MNPLRSIIFCFLPIAFFCVAYAADDDHKIAYWNVQRKGANYFNQIPSEDWFVAAKEAGIQFARLAPDKWKCERRDFLIGDADSFTEISNQDLDILNAVLDQAYRNDIKVVITLLSLPGSRWKQNNQDVDDLRIWKQKEYRDQAILFWRDLAKQLKNHPAIVGYNILNEPHPERLSGISDYRQIDFLKWYTSVKESLADLNLFYQDVVQAIREVDSSTPIIVDTGLYATPWAIIYLRPIKDDNIVYSFHMYEPYAYTTRKINNERFTYPGSIPLHLEEAEQNTNPDAILINWKTETLKQFLSPVVDWQKKYDIPATQILVGEFGCDRTSKGAEKYLSDLIDTFNFHNWHWAFYSFREDCWDSMDYELGSGKLPWEYWEAIEQNTSLDTFRKANALFDVIKNDLINDPQEKKSGV
ncbi:MAG: glycoside hydrolase family 5 protein [Chlamydiales bacterium]|nr:glycoside hydrolase family 5 protein [Chlamydiales bacterium]